MTKMEALKDVKITLDSVISKLETHLFINGIDAVENKLSKPKEVTLETK